MGLDIFPRLESDTSRAPGVNGAAASLESPWRVVGLRSIQGHTISHSNIFQSIAFSSISCSFQYMLMSCSTSPIALLYSSGWIDVLGFATHCGSESIDLSCIEKFYFLKGERKKHRLLTSLKADSRLLLFSSHWTPRLMDATIRGSHTQTTQRTLVLEGTCITHVAWHLSQTDVIALAECVRSALSLFFLF